MLAPTKKNVEMFISFDSEVEKLGKFKCVERTQSLASLISYRSIRSLQKPMEEYLFSSYNIENASVAKRVLEIKTTKSDHYSQYNVLRLSRLWY